MINRECGIHHSRYQTDTAFFRVPLARFTIIAVLVFGAVVLPFFAGDYLFSAILLPFLIWTLACIGLNLMAGYCGQISLGHAAFAAVGGYTGAILYIYGVPFILSVFLAGVGAALFGLLFGIPSARVKGLYLAMATLAAQFFLPWLLSRLVPLVVPVGLAVAGGDTVYPPAVRIFGWEVDTYFDRYYVCLGFLVLLTVFAMNLVRTRIGRAWIAIRDHDVAARILGIDIFRYKLLAFAIGTFYAGIAGALLVFFYFGVAHAGEFHLFMSVYMIGAVIIGGLGSIIGNYFGVALIVLLPIFLNQLLMYLGGVTGVAISTGIIAGVEHIIFGIIVIVFLVVEPLGMAKLYQNFKDYFRLWPFSY